MTAVRTPAAAVKVALAARLSEQMSGLSETADVQVAYAIPGDIERECVYLGSARFARRRLGPGFDEETLTLNLHVYVRVPGGRVEETDARAVEIGGVLEGLLAADRELRGVDGVMFSTVESGELAGGFEDDAAVSALDYAISFRSAVR